MKQNTRNEFMKQNTHNEFMVGDLADATNLKIKQRQTLFLINQNAVNR